MLIGSRRKLNTLTPSPILSISTDTPINQVSVSKSLGVLIDANLTSGSHIKKLARKIASGIKRADKLQKLHNRAARVLTFSSYDADASQLFQNLNWKNLSTQRDIQRALMAFKSLNGLAPDYLSSKFIALSKTTSLHFSRYCK